MEILEKYSLEISVTSFWVTFLFLGPFLVATNNPEALVETGGINWAILLIISLLIAYILINVIKKMKKEQHVAILFSVALMTAWLLNVGLADSTFFEKNLLINRLLKTLALLAPNIIMLLIIKKRRIFVGVFCIIVIVMQLTGLINNVYGMYRAKTYIINQYMYDKNQWEEFSDEKNIVVFIVDMLESNFVAEIIENSDTRKTLKDFTYYPDNISTANFTFSSVPAIFSAIIPDKNINPRKKDFIDKSLDQSVLQLFKNNQFDVDVMTFTSPFFFREFPDNSTVIQQHLLNHIFKYNTWNSFWRIYAQYMSKFTVGSIKIELITDYQKKISLADKELLDLNIKPVNNTNKKLKIIHFWGLHNPTMLDGDDNLTTMKARNSDLYLSSDRMRAIVKSFENFITQLKQLGLYDNTAIIILGDHGIVNRPQQTIVENFKQTNFDFLNYSVLSKRSNTGLLIKPMNTDNNSIKVDYSRTSSFDIAKTISDMAKLENDFMGYDILESNTIPKNRIRLFFEHGLNNDIPIKKWIVNGSVGDASGWKLEEEF